MSEKSMRGTRLGGQSLESDRGVQPAERTNITYICPSGHPSVVPMSIEADIPSAWECRCGRRAFLLGTDPQEVDGEAPVVQARTHWDMLLERRSKLELEGLLAERLEILRNQHKSA